jgi:hypothetical protein
MPIVMTGVLIAITLLWMRVTSVIITIGPLWLDITPFDDLVQFAAIEPDTATLRAVVDFDALPIRHRQRCFTCGT